MKGIISIRRFVTAATSIAQNAGSAVHGPLTAPGSISREEGQTLVEYSLIITIMAISLLVTLTVVGVDVNDFYVSVGNAVADTLP